MDNAWAWQMYSNYYDELASSRQQGFEMLFNEALCRVYDRCCAKTAGAGSMNGKAFLACVLMSVVLTGCETAKKISRDPQSGYSGRKADGAVNRTDRHAADRAG